MYKRQKQEETSENEEQGQTEQSRQTVAEENDAEQAKTAGNLEVHFIDAVSYTHLNERSGSMGQTY